MEKTGLKKIAKSRQAVEFLKNADPKLKTLIEKVGAPKLFYDSRKEVYESLVRSIVFQQLHGKAAATILGRFRELFPDPLVFPTPESVLSKSRDELLGVGLSRAKLAAIVDLSQKVIDKTVPLRAETELMSDDELIQRLTQVKGIGRWTVEMFLIFTLGRPDIFPTLDFAVHKGFHLVFKKRKILSPKELDRVSEKFKPYRSMLAWYMWRAVDLQKEKK